MEEKQEFWNNIIISLREMTRDGWNEIANNFFVIEP